MYAGQVRPNYQPPRAGAGIMLNPKTDPRAPAPVAPTVGAIGSDDNGNFWQNIALGTQTNQAAYLKLRNNADTIGVNWDVFETLVGTSTFNTTVLFSNVFDHWLLFDRVGTPIVNMNGGTMMELWEILGTDGLKSTNVALAASTAQQEQIVDAPGFWLPVERGPYKTQPVFNTLAGASGTSGTTSDTITLGVQQTYGDLPGRVTSNFLIQPVTLNATGYTDLSPIAVPQDVILDAVFFTGITLANIDEFTVSLNRSIQEPRRTGLQLQQRMFARFPVPAAQSLFPANSLIYIPSSKTAINENSYFRIHNTAGSATVNVGFSWKD